MATWRNLGILIGLCATAPAALAQTQILTDPPKAGDCSRYDLALTLKGEIRVTRDGKIVALPLAATAAHRFTERILDVKEKNLPTKAARYYDQAKSTLTLDGSSSTKALRDDRRLMIAQRDPDRFVCYSPAGPLTRDELELAGEHFDTLAITGILPEKDVKIGDGWKLSNEAVLCLCQFEALVSNDLTAKFESVTDGFAIVSVAGKAQGIELGALAKIEVKAAAKYEILSKKLVYLEWKQNDDRNQGPASPACTVEATTIVKRSAVDTPNELTDSALVSVPNGTEIPAALTLVYHRDLRNRYDVAVTREWNLVAQTDTHIVLRLIDKGDLVAQASLTAWPKAPAGKHLDPEDFKKAMAEAPGWQIEEILDAGEVPAENGRWIYRVIARGAMDDLKVVQNFYLIAGPSGEQTVATFTMKPGQTAKLGSKDLTLVGSIGFLKK